MRVLINFVLICLNFAFWSPNLSIIIFLLIMVTMLSNAEAVQSEGFIPAYLKIWDEQREHLRYLGGNLRSSEKEGIISSRI